MLFQKDRFGSTRGREPGRGRSGRSGADDYDIVFLYFSGIIITGMFPKFQSIRWAHDYTSLTTGAVVIVRGQHHSTQVKHAFRANRHARPAITAQAIGYIDSEMPFCLPGDHNRECMRQ